MVYFYSRTVSYVLDFFFAFVDRSQIKNFWHILSKLFIYFHIYYVNYSCLNILLQFKNSLRMDRLRKNITWQISTHRRRSSSRSLSCHFGVISIQTIRTSCIRGLLGTVYRYLGQSHVLDEAIKAFSPKRTIPPVPSDPITSRPSLVEMSETLFIDSRFLWSEKFSRWSEESLMVCILL